MLRGRTLGVAVAAAAALTAAGSYQRVDTPYSRAFLNSWIAASGG